MCLGILSDQNEIREKCTAAFDELSKNPDRCYIELVKGLATASDLAVRLRLNACLSLLLLAQVRQFCAVMLRQVGSRNCESTFQTLSD